MLSFHICELLHERADNLKEPPGHVCSTSVADIQLLMPSKCIVSCYQMQKN